METKLIVEWGWDVDKASVLRGVGEITRCFPSLDHAIATIVGPVGGLPVSRGHRLWRQEHVARVPTPDGLPRRDPEEVSPRGTLLVEVDVIKGSGQPRPSMGSFFGYDGIFVSALIGGDGGIIDARYQQTAI